MVGGDGNGSGQCTDGLSLLGTDIEVVVDDEGLTEYLLPCPSSSSFDGVDDGNKLRIGVTGAAADSSWW